MTLLNTINVGGADYGITGAAIIGSCPTPAGSEVKICSFTDTFQLKAGDLLLIKFTYANTYGDGSTTYPKLQINGTNYTMRRADGDYVEAGEWDNNATLTFLFDGTDFILPAGSSTGGASVPLGTVLAIYSNQVPEGYLPCNGVQFDSAQFAALYALLGDDHTPDLREVTLRGIGHNGTYVFDSTETDPSTEQAGTQNHDEYTLGEFKDDQLQNHTHAVQFADANNNYYNSLAEGQATTSSGGHIFYRGQSLSTPNKGFANTIIDGRQGTVTRGKSVGVNYIIKATSGLPDDQQDYILNQLAPVDEVTVDNMHSVTSNAVAESLSYSTTEQKTGGVWIDGKPIYRKVINVNGYPTTIQTGIPSTSEVINLICKNTVSGQSDAYIFSGLLNNSSVYYPWVYELSADNSTLTRLTGTYSGTVKFIIIEYTKTAA